MTTSITSFFQIITNSAFQQGKLKFPNKYVHEHGKELYDKARLSIPTGCCWEVRVKREDDGTNWLQNGFRKFMEDNSVGMEYFLIFKHEGNSKFVVHIFDLTATEIDYNYRSDSERCNVVNESNHEDSDDSEDDSFEDESGDKDSDCRPDDSFKNDSVYKAFDNDLDDSFKYEILDEDDDDSHKHESNDKDNDDGFIECLGSTTDHLSPQVFAEPSEFVSMDKQNAAIPRKTGIMHKQRASRATNQSVIKAKQSRNDGNTLAKKMQPMVPSSFRVSMRPLHIWGLLRIPCKFARKHMNRASTLIKLIDSDNKEWDVGYLHQDRNNFFLSQGLCRFARHKGLKVGDICVFESIGSSEEIKLKVNIL